MEEWGKFGVWGLRQFSLSLQSVLEIRSSSYMHITINTSGLLERSNFSVVKYFPDNIYWIWKAPLADCPPRIVESAVRFWNGQEGFRKYDFTMNNCEHFATYCTFDKCLSKRTV